MSHPFVTPSPILTQRQYPSSMTTPTSPGSVRWQRQSALFGSTPSPSRPTKRFDTTEALRSSLGYFAFVGRAPESGPTQPPSAKNTDHTTERAETQTSEASDGWSERQERDTSAHAARLEREQAEATQGEFDWVRSGGILRDAHGCRDKVRTEVIRAEIRKREEEEEIMRTWNAYEERWRTLTRPGNDHPIRFRDIPWPQLQESAADREQGVLGTVLGELDVGSMQRFFLATLRVRTNKMTRKELVRAAWLRWHPDKLVSVLGRVVPEDVSMVQEGISLVMVCLKALQGG